MLNKKDTTSYLQALGLSRDESAIYLELLKGPCSHLKLARNTGVNRTKVYRLADQLEKRSLITTQTDDRGTMLVASDPKTLEVELVTREEAVKNERAIFMQLLPNLAAIQSSAHSPERFIVQTYEGIEGFKQMLWHELKAQGELAVFGSGTVEDLVPSKRWAEKHRSLQAEAGYTIRELINPGKKTEDFTKNADFLNHFSKRLLPETALKLENQVIVYNNTVATYCWRDEQKIGIEVINQANAEMMRGIFEQYWQIAGKC